MQQVTAEQLHDDPRFYYLSEPGYIAAIRELLSGRQALANLKNQRYSTAKINDDRKDIIDKFLQDYQAVYDSFSKRCRQSMDTIQNSYSEPNNEQFTDELDALNELLRRQSAKAKYSLMTDDELKDFVAGNSVNLIGLPLYDQQIIVEQLKKRHIDYSLAELKAARDNQYQNDPNWLQSMQALDGIQYSQPNGLNTFMGVAQQNDDGSVELQFYTPNDILNSSSQQAAAIEADLKYMASLGSKRQHDFVAATVKQIIDTRDTNSDQYKIADNDPRINENGSKYNWGVWYDFLNERFSSDPRIASNPIYSDALSSNYDIKGKYQLMRSIYYEKLNGGQYKPVKIVNTHGKNPEEMSDKEIAKVFGAD
ncbi:hypothetical protein [Limosilactobacillus frumenti]|uniref:hypothetical protein n=1 Tax=Limosilactobacillus frumenti TaxID=104955 RepID=UPI0015EB3713|nr:hypothetical protein [Limosilactobacillus frumenti]MBA2914763.1 hypothetical protein [Limosilactobacillus frumenti]